MKFNFENFGSGLSSEHDIRENDTSLDRDITKFFERGKEQFPERIREFVQTLTEKEAILFQDYATKLSNIKFNDVADERHYDAAQELINIIRTLQHELTGEEIEDLVVKNPEQIETYIYGL